MPRSPATVSPNQQNVTRPTSSPTIPGSPAQFVELWWGTIPRKLRRYSTLLWAVWSDGAYLTAWPRLATTLVIAVLLFGFIEGGTHWSYRTIVGSNGFAGNVLAPSATADGWGGPTRIVFADNLLLLMVAVGLGSLSANLGLTLVIGYALGDVLLAGIKLRPDMRFDDPITLFVYQHVPLIVSYLLFLLLAAMPIVLAEELCRSAHPRVQQSKPLSVTLTAVIEALLIYCWGCMAPMVFRTVYLWPGNNPRIQVPFYSQITATWLVPIAVLAVVVRSILREVAARKSPAVENARITGRGLPAKSRLPKWARAAISAAIVTLLLTGFLHTPSNYYPGVFSNFLEAEIIFGLLFAALVIWFYVLPKQRIWRRWTVQVNQYPALLRLATATVAGYLLCRLIILIPGAQSNKGGEFGPEVAAILIGVTAALFLLPNGWFGLAPSSRVVPALNLPVRSSTFQIGLVGFIVLVVTQRAFADCYDFACCFLGNAGTAAASVGGAIPWLGGIAAGPVTTPDPCAAEREAVQQDEDEIKSLQGLIDTEMSQLSDMRNQIAEQIALIQNEALVALAESATNPLIAGQISYLQAQVQGLGDPANFFQENPVDFFSNLSLSNMDTISGLAGAALGLAGAGPFPLPATTQFLADLLRLPGELAAPNGVLNLIQDLKKQLQRAQDKLQKDEYALSKCEANHPGASGQSRTSGTDKNPSVS